MTNVIHSKRLKKISRQYQEAIAESNYIAFQEAEMLREERSKISYRKLKANEIDEAMALVERVFLETIATSFTEDMVAFFKEEFVHNQTFIEDYKNGICKIYGAVAETTGKIVGVLALNRDGNKINLLFVDKKYTNAGVATALIKTFLQDNQDIDKLSVNCPAGNEAFFKTFGFREANRKAFCGKVIFTPLLYMRR